jgi:hypothetical protein
MTKLTENDTFNGLQRAINAARDCNGMNEPDDLASARPSVWLIFVWLAVCAVMAMLLTACGAGIDDADELYGPPAALADVKPAKPCPVNVSACHPDPTGG